MDVVVPSGSRIRVAKVRSESSPRLHQVRKYDVLSLLVEAARCALKEKVVRVCFATMRNLYEKAHEVALLPMVGHKVMNLCDTLLARKWSDEDIVEDLQYLRDELEKNVQKLRFVDVDRFFVDRLAPGMSIRRSCARVNWSGPHRTRAIISGRRMPSDSTSVISNC